LMAALISPVFHFFSQGTVPEEWTSSWSLSPVEQLDYAAQGQSLHAELEEEALAQYRLKLEEELRKLAVSHCGEQTELWAELDEEGQLKGLELCFYGVSRESAAACLQDLARQSALPEEQIHCEIRSEGVAGDGK
ncbi:MAG: hypothetical protein Q4B50_06800, partial [Bacillota bacterium]|nr:hypothetical protein [Bacillota bacterium]